MAAPKPYQVIAARKKAEQWDKVPESWRIPADRQPPAEATNLMDIPLSCGILDETDARITSDYDATALLAELKAGRYSAEQVAVAFCKRAAIAHQLTNCLTEIFFDEAIQRARQLDIEHHKTPSRPLPPLFGLPVSLKDSFAVAGHDTSTGIAAFVNEPSKTNSSLARLLLDLGAVLYCKTNLPQSVLTGDTHNNVFGRTLNPNNTSLTVGGSTGGEGALVALRGSILGVGTDIGGSIRAPAVCNGIYGFRASVGLVPYDGVRNLNPPGTSGLLSTAGPMATSLRDCELFMKVLMREGRTWRYDSTAVYVPWVGGEEEEEEGGKGQSPKLRIGVAMDDGAFTPTPPVRRGLQLALDRLRDNDKGVDVELVPVTLPDVKTIYTELVPYLALCGGQHYLDMFAKTSEPVIPSLAKTSLPEMPATTDLQTLFNLNSTRAGIVKTYFELYRDKDLDAIIMPPAPHTALAMDTWIMPAYTCIWNYLDYPAVVIPVDKVRDGDVADGVDRAEFGEDDREMYSLYTGPEQYKDAPVCVQLVGFRQRDEALLRVAKVVDSIIAIKRKE